MSILQPVSAKITLVHNPTAGKSRSHIKIKANTGLSLRNAPWTDIPTFRSAKTHFRINLYGTLHSAVNGTKGTDFAAGGVKAVHATSGRVNMAAIIKINFGNVEPIVGSESVRDFTLL